jgi:hypothetical protein
VTHFIENVADFWIGRKEIAEFATRREMVPYGAEKAECPRFLFSAIN